MKKYEIMYIIQPKLENTKSLIEEMNQIFAKYDSKVIKTNEVGMKSLAYEINKLNKGFYVELQVEATAEAIDEFNRLSKIKEDIIRYIVLKV